MQTGIQGTDVQERKRRHHVTASPEPSPQCTDTDTTNLQPVPSILRAAVEKAAAMAKNDLGSAGKITPAALFVYGSIADPEATRTTTVSLYWRNELQKEAVRRRIREKALLEGACAVVVLNTEDRVLLISGRTSTNTGITASVDYLCESDAQVVSRWDLQWRDNPVTDFFLEGVFDTASIR
jgi:hypothetical protein